MKMKTLVISSVVLIPAICLISRRAVSTDRPADFRDAVRDVSPMNELQEGTKGAKVLDLSKSSVEPSGANKAVSKPGTPVPAGQVPGLTQSGDIPLPSLAPDAAGWFLPPAGYTEGGTFAAAADKPEWKVSKARPAAGAGELRVMSWNVSRGQKLDKVIQVIKKANPDVLILCEADLYGKMTGGKVAAREIASALGYSYYAGAEFGELRDDRRGTSGNAIISRYPLSGGKFLSLPIMKSEGGYDWADDGGQPRTGQRNSLAAYIEVPGQGKTTRINIVSMHTENKANAKVRLAQFELIAKELVKPGEATILAGDLNTVSMGEGGSFRSFLKKSTFFDCSNGDDRPTFSAALIVSMRLDWVLLQEGADKAAAFKSYDVISKEGASDHSPVITGFKLK